MWHGISPLEFFWEGERGLVMGMKKSKSKREKICWFQFFKIAKTENYENELM